MTNFTKKAIKEAFMKLLDQKPLSQITVKDIVTECGINRNSFYYHFADLPALAEEIMTEQIDSMIMENASINTLEDSFRQGIRYAMENKRAMYHIYDSVNRDIFERYLMQASGYVVRVYFDNTLKDMNISSSDRRLIINYYKYVIFGAVIDWMESGMKSDIEGDLKRICEIMVLPDLARVQK